MYNLKDTVKIASAIHGRGWEIELSEFENEVYLCGYKENDGIMETYKFDNTFVELQRELDKHGYGYYESQD